MTNPCDSVATLRLLAQYGSMDLSMLGPIADEFERLNRKCSALALLLYGPNPNAVEPCEQPDYQHLYQGEVASKMVLQGEYDSLKSDLHAMTNAADTLDALKTAHQALLEVAHAQECGPGWYTRGEAGLFQQTRMWIRRGLDALNKTRPVWQPTSQRT